MRPWFVCFWWGKVVGSLGTHTWSNELAATFTCRKTREKQFHSFTRSHCTAERANIEKSHTILTIVHPTIGGSATRRRCCWHNERLLLMLMLLSRGVAQHRRLRSSSKERLRKRLPEVWFRMLLKRPSALHSFLAEKQSGRGNESARIGWTFELTAFQWPRPGGSVAGDLQHRRAEVQEGIRRPLQSSTYRRRADATSATTLREPLQALAESWPLRPR